MNFVDAVAEGERFMRVLPAPTRMGSVGGAEEMERPWADLLAIWRLAFLEDGLREEQDATQKGAQERTYVPAA